MTEAIEQYIMREEERRAYEKEHKKDEPAVVNPHSRAQKGLPALFERCRKLGDVYTTFCQDIKMNPDPETDRVLQIPVAEVTELDFSTIILTPANFDVVMQLCAYLPNLRKLNLSQTGLKTESILNLVETVKVQGKISSINLDGNAALGFAAAKLLLPMLKQQRYVLELSVEGTSMAIPTKELISKVLEANQRRAELEPAGSPPGSPKSQGSPTKGAPGSPFSTRSMADLSVSEFDMTMDSNDGAAQAKQEQEMKELANSKLLDTLMDNEDAAMEFVKSLKAQQKEDQTKMDDFGVTTGLNMEEFREGYQWPVPSSFDYEAAVQRYELNVDPADLADILKEYQPLTGPTYINIKTQLTELLDGSTTRRRKTAIQGEVAKKVERHGPGGAQFCEYVAKFVDLLGQDASAMAEIKKILDETEEQMQELRVKIEALQRDRAKFTQEEDLRNAEVMFEATLEAEEGLIDLVLYRLGQLLARGSKVQLNLSLDKYTVEAKQLVEDTSNSNADVQGRLEEDVENLKQQIKSEQEAVEQRANEFEDIQRSMDSQLVDNRKQQERVWSNIEKQLEQLEELNSMRTTQVNEFLEKVQENDHQNVESAKRIEFCEGHIKRLEELLHDCNANDQITKSFAEWFDIAARTVKAAADSSSSEGDELALEERKKYLAVFKKYYVDMGELLFRKTKRLEEVDRMIRNCEFQIDFCKETLDPDLPRYKNQLKDFHTRRIQIANQVTALQDRGDERAKVFLPHEQELRKAGEEFDSPVLIMHEFVVESRARVLGQRQKFIARDKEELLDKEAQQIDEMAASTLAAREAGNTKMLPSLDSPDKGSQGSSKVPQPPRSPNRQHAAPRSGPQPAAP
uniref:Uncharacterized protein n=1 Tax=Eutreptiella gymnastica TaxID=73025 RepID=A0A7S1IHX1_9EUGL|mmetsp:Transcript_19602/g.34781  ORF Transcript_19602/g.34781 Transcript_19602/m.34781 type:complete len:856 (+) Transcript_19602:44-2611(+)